MPSNLATLIAMTNQTTPYPAPDFKLSTSDGQEKSLQDFTGKWLVLYFYPMADTSGCTAEACGMRDARDELTDLGVEVVGVSRDEPADNDAFKAKYNLNFTLLSDPDQKTIRDYDAYDAESFGGIGTQRKTFLIDPQGQVQKVYSDVTPEGHADEVVADLRELQA